jgi:hypothetical protein
MHVQQNYQDQTEQSLANGGQPTRTRINDRRMVMRDKC